jgi:hypothetical protein
MTHTLQDLASEFDALDREARHVEGSSKLTDSLQLTRALLGEALHAYGEDDEHLFGEVSDVMPAQEGIAKRVEDLLVDIRAEIGALAA